MSSVVSVVEQNESTRFVAVRYRDAYGCVGVYTMVLACYGGLLKKALKAVMAMDDGDLMDVCPPMHIWGGLDLMQRARKALIVSYQGRIARHDDGITRPGQYTEAFKVDGESIKGLRQHVDDPSRVYVAGLKVRFRLIEPGEDRPVTCAPVRCIAGACDVAHKPLTVAKKAIERDLNIAKWRTLKACEIVTIGANGERFDVSEDANATI